MRTALATAVTAASLLVSASGASAAIVPFVSDPAASTEGLGSFTGSLDYAPVSAAAGTLVVTITNTVTPAAGGKITGIAFDIPSSDPAAAASLLTASHPFLNDPNPSTPPYTGPFEGGAALGGNFLGNGNPNTGVAPGATGTFTFAILASDAQSLTSAAFLGSPGQPGFLARFRGFANGGSDKVPAVIVPDNGTDAPTPGATAVLAGAGVLAARRRRR